jgi:hypothetical protein
MCILCKENKLNQWGEIILFEDRQKNYYPPAMTQTQQHASSDNSTPMQQVSNHNNTEVLQ